MKIKKTLKQSQIIRNVYFLTNEMGWFLKFHPVDLVKIYKWFFTPSMDDYNYITIPSKISIN